MNSKLYQGRVFHQRLKPKKHRLSYRIFSLLVDIDELPELGSKLTFFSYNRLNLFSFWDKDYGPGDGEALRPYVTSVLQGAGLDIGKGAIKLLCYPRMFGYVFNPLSIYFCYNEQNSLKAIVYEVSNTFGERHSYVIPAEVDGRKTVRQSCRKGFYVSPFMKMDCDYHFAIQPPTDRISVAINQTDKNGAVLKACFSGTELELSDRTLLWMLVKFPLMTLKVVAGIHWEALKLWLKGLRLESRPAPPASSVTYVDATFTEPKS